MSFLKNKSILYLTIALTIISACKPHKNAQHTAKHPLPPPPIAVEEPPKKVEPPSVAPLPAPPPKPVEAPKPTELPTATLPPPTVPPNPKPETKPYLPPPAKDLPFMVGADRMDYYLPMLGAKRVALAVNQTSTANGMHLVDALLSVGVDIKKVFAPEHGFRGEADAGEKVANGRDLQTNLPIVSLYGNHKKPTAEDLANIDVVIFDIQDVGARFYTYISTLHYIMEACAENGKTCIVLDRPNPNGFYVDGPVLEAKFTSFVGMHPIPIVHGLTVGELAQMINGEKWLAGARQCDLLVVSCVGYTHLFHYNIPIKPSPNLPNNRAIYLYPSLCLFEGTPISVGRGTDQQFQVIGSPALAQKMKYKYTPGPKLGAKKPLYESQTCYGQDLSMLSVHNLEQRKTIDLQWLLEMYKNYPSKDKFFNSDGFFDKLAGTTSLREQIKANWSEEKIRSSWQPALTKYKVMRKKYLLYPDFE